ncbi:hypothetical protein BS50DRAFT_573439 [Corynespora cassiicola Philippines]|uniref:1-alkyl-2-acetylglycerophosphocholine esterase n=1 Tax=Corynespora cassiicola Philippines TaxID=1448308 RepID=A0A2T2NMK3_CORCC|nr:hypothetical protein BS50DRAFT_573439 [Corynespora cassiicola Philippines]
MVVFAPDHRDGSAPISFIHTPDKKEKLKKVEYKRVAHKASTEVYEARDEQLRTRLWEMNLVHEAILKLDAGKLFKNVAEGQKKDSKDLLSMFANKLAVHEPGSIAFAGHSFGAATTVQFIKSIFYRPTSPVSDYTPLFTPSDSSPLIRQITPSTPIALLDLWTLPLHSPHTSYLRSKPMPCYASPQGGKNLIAILSEAFYKWTANLNDTKRAIAKPPGSDRPGPHIFYPVASAHLSQSDFGVLFPWVTTKIFGAKEPERVLRLNARAVLQVLREAGVEVADTRVEDLELEGEGEVKLGEDVKDERILSRKGQGVRGWVSLSAEPETEERETSKGPGDAVVEGEVLGEVVTERERSET